MRNMMLALAFFTIIKVSGQSVLLTGNVRDEEGQPLAFATLQLWRTESKVPVGHTLTDLDGKYSIELNGHGNYVLIASCLGFINEKYPISMDSANALDTVKDFILKVGSTTIKEVVINPETFGRISPDTVCFYVARYTDGSEKVLKDILNKLPGIEVKEDGKIIANGRSVEKLLIDGEDFFFDQPKMATENLSAEMISNIQLLNNYYNNPLQKDFSQDGQLVLNVGLKSDYKGKLSGNLSSGGGIQDKYSLHSNIYYFGTKMKTGFICDANNTGDDAFTFDNLNGFMSGVGSLIQNEGSRGSLTRFNQERELDEMNGGKNARLRNSRLAGLNLSYRPDARFKLNSYIVLNKNYRNEYEEVNRTRILSEGVLEGSNQINLKRNKFQVGTYFDARYMQSENLSLSYKASIGLSNADEKSIINDHTMTETSFYDQNKINSKWLVSQFLNLTGKYKARTLLGLNLYQETMSTISSAWLASDTLFLSLPMLSALKYEVLQDNEYNKNLFGLEVMLTRKLGKTMLRSTAGFNRTNWPLSSQLSQIFSRSEQEAMKFSGYDNNLDYAVNDLRYELFWIKNKGFFQFRIGPVFHYFRSKENRSEKSWYSVSPNITVMLRFREGHDLLAGYHEQSQLPGPADLAGDMLLNNYRTFSAGRMNLNDNSLNRILTLQYVFYDLFTGTVISFSGNHSLSLRPSISSVAGFSNYNIIYSISGNNSKNYNCNLALSKKLGFIPLSFSIKGFFNDNFSTNYLNASANKFHSTTWTIGSGFSTNFRFPVNGETGLDYSCSIYRLGMLGSLVKMTSIRPFLRVNCSLKSGLFANLSFARANYSTNLQSNRSWVVDFDVRFRPVKRKAELFLIVDNLLNLNNYEQIDIRYQQNYFDERIYSILPGSIITGIRYNLR